MKTNLLKFAAASLAALLLSVAAKADLINGNISFAGSMSTNNGGIVGATTINFPAYGQYVFTVDGDFASYVSVYNAATFAPSWNFSSGGSLPGLWSVGGFTFNLQSSSIIVQGLVGNNYWLVIEGTGTVVGNGFDPTVGSWSFTTQNKNNTSTSGFSFSAQSSAVPDGGTTALLVGLGLVGMSVIARRRK
ncbi:MAG TPA: hypothetical protein PLB90_02385 [Opitutaceae bacterium]|nr:hypothetical protein [Opitutaceae bacterium]